MNIALHDTVFLLNDRIRRVSVTVTDDKTIAVLINSDDVENDHLVDVAINIQQDKAEDVEYIADLFAFEYVCVFAVVVKLLGKVMQAKALL